MKTVLSSVTNGPLTVDEGGTPTQFIENHSREGSANGSVNRSRQPSEFHQDGGVSAVHSSLEGSATRSVNHSRQPSEFPQDDGLPIKSSYEPERSANHSVVREVSEARTDIHSRGRSLHRSSTNRVPSQTASSSPSNSRSRSVSESRKHLKNAPFFNDAIPTGCPAIKDYSPPIRRRLLDTVFIYENWILSNDGFPDKEVQYSWARESWEICNRNTSEQFKLSERMVKLVKFISLVGFILSLTNFFRSRLEVPVFVVISRTSSGRSFQLSSNLVQVRAGVPFSLTLSVIFFSWKTRNFTTRFVVACAS